MMFRQLFFICSYISVALTTDQGADSVNVTDLETKIKQLEQKLEQAVIYVVPSTDHKNGAEQRVRAAPSSGPVYIRWGKHSCPANGTEIIYWGYVGGSWFEHTGAATNRLCMPSDPVWRSSLGSGGSNGGFIHGAEYQESFSSKAQLDFDVPCAVCRVVSRSTVVMIPGRDICYPGWTLEYYGELTSGHHGHKGGSEFLCLDNEAESVKHSKDNDNGCLFYYVQAQCTSLPCPPYQQGRRIACSVCSL